ncbi:MAG: hypothetical protein ACRC7O_18865 [Fimbriiglobus sp.]
MPILLAIRELLAERITIYSGVRMYADVKQGLVGECDFVLTRTPPHPEPRTPVMAIVEAKWDNLDAGLGQCVAQMVGAKVWNDRDGTPQAAVFGCVTSGEVWQFPRLAGSVVTHNQPRCYLDNVPRILGMLAAILGSVTAESSP